MIQDITPHKLYNEFKNEEVKEDSIIFSFKNRQVLVKNIDGNILFPTYKEIQSPNNYTYLLTIDETTCFMSHEELKISGYKYEDVWSLRHDNKEDQYLLYTVTTAFQLYNWYRKNVYCGVCGHKMIQVKEERALECPNCHNRVYPRINPAVIVGVKNGDELLLTRYAKGFKHNALVAGFVEIGETLEECVQREVYEEVGLKVKNIQYYKSQPWGFVDDILMGFYCEVDGDPTIHLDTNELKIGVWTKREDIVLQPDHLSLTNEMMQMFKEHKID